MPDAIAIDLGGTNIRAARITTDGLILARERCPTAAHEGFPAVVRKIAHLAGKLKGSDTLGIGLGTPGSPDPTTGVMICKAVNIPDSEGFPLGQELAQATGLSVRTDNDANLAALGESWLGAARGEAVALMLTFGTGVGGGLVLSGQLYHGGANMTEFGHICVEADGLPCPCGCRGCLEMYASASAFARAAREAMTKDPGATSSLLWKRSQGIVEVIDARMLCDAARDGDELARRVFTRCCDYLAAGAGSLINALNPTCLVLGGGLALAGDIFFQAISDGLTRDRAFRSIWARCKLVPAQLGDDAGLFGAAHLAFMRPGNGIPGRDR